MRINGTDLEASTHTVSVVHDTYPSGALGVHVACDCGWRSNGAVVAAAGARYPSYVDAVPADASDAQIIATLDGGNHARIAAELRSTLGKV